jgi:glycosyltransferase involved in cell wall biosynthesis
VPIALDTTYSLGRNLSGVGVYSRQIAFGLARAHPEELFLFCYRPHRFFRSIRDPLPPNARRRILKGVPNADLFHALNQRLEQRARRTVTTFHDLFVLTGEYSTPEFRARFTEQARRAARDSDLIIAVSQFTASQVEALLNVEPSRIRVVPHGVEVPLPTAGNREEIVLFAGVIQKRKNVARLVRAFEQLPGSWRLILAGATEGYGAAQELRAVEESPRRASIQVLGYVSDEELKALYARASIFALPSLDEGFGIPVLEAMAHGVPVITSRRSALPEVAGDAALFTDPENQDQLTGQLARLAGDEDLRADLSRRGRERALEFPWSAAVEKTWAVYRELRG